MKNVAFLFILLLPFFSNGQRSIVEMLTKFSSSNQTEFIKSNHQVKSYTLHFDEEVKADTTLTINDEIRAFKSSDYKRYTWNNDILSIVRSAPSGESQISEIFEFDKNKNVIMHDLKYDDMKVMNEKMTYTYDEKNRLLNIKLIKENMGVDNQPFIAEYEGENLLPISAKMNTMMEFDIKRTPNDIGFRYDLIGKIPQELYDMTKEELGGNPSEKEILEAMGPFGKVPKKYSDIAFLSNGHMKEDVYEEDQNVLNKIDLVSTITFDQKFNIINKKIFEDGALTATYTYEYNDKGQVVSTQKDEEPKKVNEFDNQGNITKEYTDFGYTLRTFENGRLMVTKEYGDGDYLMSFDIYTY